MPGSPSTANCDAYALECWLEAEADWARSTLLKAGLAIQAKTSVRTINSSLPYQHPGLVPDN